MVSIYPILHLLVDGLCAMSMFAFFLDPSVAVMNILLYNMLAFALQMPFGVLVDMMPGRRKYDKEKHCMHAAILGVVFTIAGSFLSPILLGIGNALFHVGGGAAAVHDDKWKNKKGLGLGIFIAPGALGLFLGKNLYNTEDADILFLAFRILAIFLCLGLFYIWYYHDEERKVQTKLRIFEPIHLKKDSPDKKKKPVFVQEKYSGKQVVLACTLCMLVVMIRSYVGLSVSYSWNEGFVVGLVGVLFVCFGKVFGGFLGSKVGFFWTSILSLAGAAICFLFCDQMNMGLSAQLLFNMTMPITLSIMSRHLPGKEAFSFGMLSFGLFLGFLPVFFGFIPKTGNGIVAAILSAVSLLLLLPLVMTTGKGKGMTDAKSINQ